MLTKNEKQFLSRQVKKELLSYQKGMKVQSLETALAFLKGEHEYEDFLKGMLKKLK
jgi:hypothetical protein